MFEENDFDDFDPDNFDEETFNSYDPDNAAGKMARAPRAVNKMQINITIANTNGQQQKVELFSAFDSILNRRKAEYVTGNFAFVPALSREGLLAAATGGAGTVGISQDGDLQILGTVGGDPIVPTGGYVKVSCAEYPYAALLDQTKKAPFQVTRLRYTVATDAQIDNPIKHFRNTMGGGTKENVINPRAYFKPNQFQGKTIDIDQSFTIDGRSGLLLTVNANETVRLSLFINV